MSIYSKFVKWLSSIRIDRLYHFMAGMIISAFFCITLNMEVCIVPAVFAGFIKEFIDNWKRDQAWDWIDFLATCIGGLVIQIFQILNVLIF